MKMIYKIAAVAFAGVFALSSCSKKDDADYYKYEGAASISGTLVGMSYDGQAMNESFSFSRLGYSSKYENTVTNDTLYSVNPTTYKQIKTPGKRFSITAFSENEGSMSLHFFADGNTVVITEYNYYNVFQFDFVKQLTGNQILNFGVDGGDIKTQTGTGDFVADNVKITNFSYDETSGEVSGDFTFVVAIADKNDVKRESTLKGSFSATCYKIIK